MLNFNLIVSQIIGVVSSLCRQVVTGRLSEPASGPAR